MIHLTKSDIPQVLLDYAIQWRDEYLEFVNNGQRPPDSIKYRYRHQDIKTQLRTDTSNKCAYCESNPHSTNPGQIDHIQPISHRPELIVEWFNLSFACAECNREKSDYYEPTEPLVNPFEDDPANHLKHFGPVVMHTTGDMKGLRTVHILKLCRPALIEKRKEKIERIQSLLDLWAAAEGAATSNVIWDQVLDECSECSEFTATARAYVEQALDMNIS